MLITYVHMCSSEAPLKQRVEEIGHLRCSEHRKEEEKSDEHSPGGRVGVGAPGGEVGSSGHPGPAC